MTKEEMKNLKTGDIVQSSVTGLGFVVTANYGGRVTAVCTVDITNPSEWNLIQKAVTDTKT